MMRISSLNSISAGAIAVVLLMSAAPQLSAQNANNPNQVALLRWYKTNQSGFIPACQDPFGFAFDGAHMWVACSANSEVEEIDAGDGTLMKTIAGVNALSLAYDGANMWVVAGTSGGITKIRASTGTVLLTLNTGTAADGIAFDGTSIWIPNGGTGGVPLVYKYTVSNGVLVGTFAVPTCPFPLDPAVEGDHIWVTCGDTPGTVIELNQNGRVLNTVNVGSEPNSIAFDGAFMWVTNSGSASVSQINVSTLAVNTIPVGNSPQGIVFDGKFIWVANLQDSTMTRINSDTSLVQTFNSPLTNPISLAFDGGNVWIGAQGTFEVAKF